MKQTPLANCSLCEALSTKGQIAVCNKVLFESTNFKLIPSIGPLALGHVLIVSKHHFESLAEMGEDNVIEFFSFLDKITQHFRIQGNFLVFEHGSFDGHKGGSCVTHTHIHLVPEFGVYFNVLDNILKEIKLESKLDISKIDYPYIFAMNSKMIFKVYEAYNVHSQMMRKAICNELNLDEWDWRANRSEKLIEKSIKFWSIDNKNNSDEK